MEKRNLIDTVLSWPNIDRLNPMQQAIADSGSRQLLLISPTGSGKTIAFALRAMREIREDARHVQMVVIAPSRELVVQIASIIGRIASANGIRHTTLYGGHNMTDEQRTLSASNPPAIIVATPGRLVDHLNRRSITLDRASTLVLDEYDKSLELGFADEMQRIVRRMPRRRTTILTSATVLSEMPDYVSLTDLTTFDFSAGSDRKTTDSADPRNRMTVIQLRSAERDKLPTLAALLEETDNRRSIVFVNHRESAERVYSDLKRRGWDAVIYHGGLEQMQRQQALDLFANGSAPVLVATDLAARGLDIEEVENIIHYHLPPTPENWTHRNGRSIRSASAHGNIYVITGPDEHLPDYITPDTTSDAMPPSGRRPQTPTMATLHFSAGRREKISKTDIVGFLIAKGQLGKDEIGRINLYDHYALCAIAAPRMADVLKRIASEKIKNQRVRITPCR